MMQGAGVPGSVPGATGPSLLIYPIAIAMIALAYKSPSARSFLSFPFLQHPQSKLPTFT